MTTITLFHIKLESRGLYSPCSIFTVLSLFWTLKTGVWTRKEGVSVSQDLDESYKRLSLRTIRERDSWVFE